MQGFSVAWVLLQNAQIGALGLGKLARLMVLDRQLARLPSRRLLPRHKRFFRRAGHDGTSLAYRLPRSLAPANCSIDAVLQYDYFFGSLDHWGWLENSEAEYKKNRDRMWNATPTV
jgi:hypothetical protein